MPTGPSESVAQVLPGSEPDGADGSADDGTGSCGLEPLGTGASDAAALEPPGADELPPRRGALPDGPGCGAPDERGVPPDLPPVPDPECRPEPEPELPAPPPDFRADLCLPAEHAPRHGFGPNWSLRAGSRQLQCSWVLSRSARAVMCAISVPVCRTA